MDSFSPERQNRREHLLIGESLQRLASADVVALPTFDQSIADQVITKIKGFDPTYYPDEIIRLSKLGFKRMYSGQVTLTTEPHFKAGMQPSFADIVVIPSTGELIVFATDQYGACGKIAFGHPFPEKV